ASSGRTTFLSFVTSSTRPMSVHMSVGVLCVEPLLLDALVGATGQRAVHPPIVERLLGRVPRHGHVACDVGLAREAVSRVDELGPEALALALAHGAQVLRAALDLHAVGATVAARALVGDV